MNNFKKGRFGGGNKGGGFNKGGFDRGESRGGFRSAPGRDFSRPMEMHQATCARCQKMCEVPFRPNGKKPVFCKDCFASGRPDVPGRDFSRPDHSARPSFRPEGGERRSDDLKAQIETLNSKIDSLTRMVQALSHAPAQKEAAVPAVKSPAKIKAKKTVKKTGKK